MSKEKSIKIGKASAILLWALFKVSARVSWILVVAVLSLIVGLFSFLDGGSSGDEGDWWWARNHGDPGHIYDKDDKN